MTQAGLDDVGSVELRQGAQRGPHRPEGKTARSGSGGADDGGEPPRPGSLQRFAYEGRLPESGLAGDQQHARLLVGGTIEGRGDLGQLLVAAQYLALGHDSKSGRAAS